LKTLAAIADAHAFEVWGSAFARGEPFPVFDSDDTAIAYVFPYAIGVSTFPAQIRIDPSQPEEKDRFGSIYVSIKPTTHPVLRVTHALHPLFVQGEQAETIGKTATESDACLTKIYWLGLHQEYFEVRSGGKRALMDVRNLKQVVPDSVLKPRPVVSKENEITKYWKVSPPESKTKEDVLSNEKLKGILKNLTMPVLPASELGKDLTPVLKLVPLADCLPVVNWTWWCVPTAYTMAVCYYDNYVKGVGGILNYGRLVGYWFDHPKSGHNVPDFIDQLIDPTTGTWRSGFSDFSDFIKKTYGYTFTKREVSANAQNDWAWNDIKSEIDAGRPFVWGVPNHATCALGYRIASNGEKFVVIHTTWGDTVTQQREEWPHTKGTGLAAITPSGGNIGQNLVVWQPDGGEKLLTNVATTLHWYIWGNQIKKAKILVSADGGKTWTTIAQAAPCTPGWNYYDWTPHTVTNCARVRILGLDANGAYVAGDGSQTNIQVLLGPRPVTLKTILIETKTDEKGFFSAPHGLERYTPDGYTIRAISVAVQHKNGNWHTLEFSNNVDNRFWWNKDVVAGIIASPNFFMRPVRVIVFAEAVVG
jgi:hypothetical protein